jgi:hypothetical protein
MIIEVGYPIYALGYFPYSREIAVSGGGGGSRSGIPNCLDTFHISANRGTSSSKILEPFCKFSTGHQTVSLIQPLEHGGEENDFLAVMDDSVCLCSKKAITVGKGNSPTKALQIKKQIQLQIQQPDAYIKCMQQTESLLALGTSDAKVHIRRLPSLKPVEVLEGFQGEIVDLAAASDGEEGSIFILTPQMLHQRGKAEGLPVPKGFAFRCCAWLANKSALLVVANSLKRDSALLLVYSQPDKSANLQLKEQICIFNRAVTCISISFDCQIAAFGTCDGSLGIIELEFARPRVREIWRELQDFAMTCIVVDYGANNLFASSANGTLTWLSIGAQEKAAQRRKKIVLFAFVAAVILLLAVIYKYYLP